MYTMKIPVERIAVLIGKNGQMKEYIEKKLKVKIEVDDEGEVTLEGESVDEFFGKDVIKAIGRGFEPSVALRLLDDNYLLRIVDLRDYVNRESMARVKGRIIGEKGKTREIIEQDAECFLSVYGHTVGVIATLETMEIALSAIFKLIEGLNHSTVYAYLEKNRRHLKGERMKKQ
ncbi:RNA-processing protein [Candidatus Micrarchaeota archaeon]|nr:RNA-processing protein [Candidatus Micrarchaeota archaeon]